MPIRRKRSVSLKRQLLLMAFFACLPALLVASYLGFSEIEAVRRATNEQARMIALNVRQTLDHELDMTIALLQGLAGSRSLELARVSGDYRQFYDEALQFLKNRGNNLVLLSPDGRQLLNTLRPLGAPLPPTNNPEAVARVVARGRPGVTDVFVGAVLQQPLVALDVPVMHEHQVQQVLRLNLVADELQQLVGRATLPAGWGLAILDSAGHFVARSRKPATGERARPGLPEAIALNTEGWVDTVTREGIPVSNIFLRSELAPWTVVVGIPQQDLTWPVVRFSLVLLAALAAVLVLAALLSSFFGYRIVNAIGKLATDQEQSVTGIVEIDAVARRLHQVQAGLRESEHRMRLAKENAEEANAAKSRFLAAMSHELRTPLNAIIGFGDLLLTRDTSPRNKEFIDIIKSAGNTLLKLIQDILDLSKIETGKITPHLSEFELDHELQSITAQFGSEVLAKHLALNLELAPDVPRLVRGDPDLLRQILLNLIGNALKFTDHGQIDLTVERAPGSGIEAEAGTVTEAEAGTVTEAGPDDLITLVFKVRDSGIGIQPENQQRIFEMFEQEEDSSTRRFGGAGLGLAISQKLVTLLGGRIWLHSTPGSGSCFCFSARFSPVARLAAPLTPGRGDGVALATAPTSQPLVLVVEDDPASRLLMTHLLSMSGYRVETANDGAAALAFLARQPADLILMDIQLPIMSGAEAAQRIRAGQVPGCRSQIPIIALTAYALVGDREKFLALGMNDYVTKPVDAPTLLAAIARFLRSAPPDGGS